MEGAEHEDSDSELNTEKTTLLSRRTASVTENLAVSRCVAWRLAA